jgi:hypothetical protein
MTKNEVFDINGVNPEVGDKIAYAVGWTTNNAYINVAVITKIVETEKTVKLELETKKTGLYAEGDNTDTYGLKRNSTLGFPSTHCKFIILEHGSTTA